MHTIIRRGLLAVSVIQVAFALAFAFGVAAVTDLWPLPDTTPTSMLFIGSIVAAAAASTLWCVATAEEGAVAGIALDYVLIFAPTAILVLSLAEGRRPFIVFGVGCAFGTAFGLWLLRRSVRIPIRDTRPMPGPVRVSFVIFILALLAVGGSLILRTPDVLPWLVTLDTGVVFGWMFIGAAAYFVYALLRPSWHNSAGQLAGFLAYDAVLLVPFLLRLPTIEPQLRPSLIIYLVVLTYSGLLAIYYLFVNARTRFGASLVPAQTADMIASNGRTQIVSGRSRSPL